MLDIMSSSGFLPLICGAATREQAEHLAHHLMSPQTFGTALPVASVACCHDNVYSKDMWRGPVWININWLIAYGFRRYGMDSIAEMILNKSIAEIEKMYLKYGTFFEFYDDRCETDPPDLLRKSRNLPDSYHQAFHDFGWTATLYIDMILVRRTG
jgi:neutral trehalase